MISRRALAPRPSRVRLLSTLAVLALAAGCSPKGEALYARAQQELGKGEVRAAMIDLKNLVKAEPKNARARALLAQALVKNGDIAGAAIEVQKARDLGAPADVLLVADCQVLLGKAEFDKVVQQCKPETAAAADRTAVYIVQGRALLALNRPEEARPLFEAARSAEPDNLDALLGVAGVEFLVRGLEGAQAVFTHATPAMQKDPQYWMAVGGFRMQGHDFAGAEQSLQKAVSLLTENVEPRIRLTALGALAETQMRQGKVKEANATVDVLMKAAPRNPIAKQLKAQALAAGGDLEGARALLEEVVAAMPENYDARTQLGMVHMMQGNLGQAEMHFSNVVSHQPGNQRAQKLLAEVRARSGSPEESLATMAPALRKADADPALLATAGRMSLAAGNRDQALSYLDQAAASFGDLTPDVQLEIANGYLMAGAFDRAIELLEKIPADEKSAMRREFLLAIALLRKGEPDKGIAQVQAMVQKSPNDPQVLNLASGFYVIAGKRDAARQALQAALKVAPKDTDTLINLARLEIVDGRPAEADKYFKQALEADPGNVIATMGLAGTANLRGDAKDTEKWLTQASRKNPDSVDAQLALAQFYLDQRQVAKAKAVVDAASQRFVDNAAVSNMRGLVALGTGDLPAAITAFKQATGQAPKVFSYANNLARAYVAAGEPGSALTLLNDLLQKNPRSIETLQVAAATAIASHKLEQASGYVTRLQDVDPDSVTTLALDGDLAMLQKRYKDALQAYRQGAAKSNGNPQMVASEFRAARLAGEPNPDKILEDWLAKYPNDIQTTVLLAESRERAGDLKGATRLYETVVEKAPGNGIALNNLATLYLQQGNPKGMEMAKRAYDLLPKSPPVQDTYGWALYLQGRNDQAVPVLLEALSNLPDNAEVQYHAGAALAKKGDKAEATRLLKKALQGSLPPAAKADAQKQLDQLSK